MAHHQLRLDLLHGVHGHPDHDQQRGASEVELDPQTLGEPGRQYGIQGWPDERVVLGPQIGEDAAVIDFQDRYLVAKTDPITFVTEEIGWYLVQVNANDLATTGAVPRWLM